MSRYHFKRINLKLTEEENQALKEIAAAQFRDSQGVIKMVIMDLIYSYLNNKKGENDDK